MLTHLATTFVLAISLVMAGPAWSYDTAMAESYAKLFAPVKGAGAGKALHLMKPEAFLNKVKAGEPLVALDVRTPAEMGVFTSLLPGTLIIPMNELFTEANLARIPTDKTVVVLCKSGTRATAAGTALRHIGFEKVYVLKGGVQSPDCLHGTEGSEHATQARAGQEIGQLAVYDIDDPAGNRGFGGFQGNSDKNMYTGDRESPVRQADVQAALFASWKFSGLPMRTS